MQGRFLAKSNTASSEPNIYADKSSLVLEWLLFKGIEKEAFSIREMASDTGVSVGQVQKVVAALTLNGSLKSTGLRTSKKFMLSKPQVLLQNWLEHYSIVKKCKMRTYHTATQGRKQLIDALNKSHLQVTLALHSAAESLGCQNTNLDTLELYIDAGNLTLVEETLQLEPQERGYEVLLIEPFYKSMLCHSSKLGCSSPLLTFLDLYHFPLRGLEQAEFLAERIPSLKRIYNKGP